MNQPRLVIAFCTRNRPEELRAAVKSAWASAKSTLPRLDSVLIVDDGELTRGDIDWLSDLCTESGREYLVYLRKHASDRGLFRSREVSLEYAQSRDVDYVSFFDDDVEIDPSYLSEVLRVIDELPDVSVVGGVDELVRAPGRFRRAFERLFLISSISPGDLSASGFGGSMWQWLLQTEPFPSEFVSGCCMTVSTNVRVAIDDLARTVFSSYSLGEDIYLARIGARVGRVIVTPRATVKHRCSPLARDKAYSLGQQMALNQLYLLRFSFSTLRALAFSWSMFGHMLLAVGSDLRQGRMKGRFAGQVSGLVKARRFLS